MPAVPAVFPVLLRQGFTASQAVGFSDIGDLISAGGTDELSVPYDIVTERTSSGEEKVSQQLPDS